MNEEATIWFCSIAIAALVSLLYHRHWRESCRQLRERHWSGHGIEVSAVAHRLDEIRHNYEGEVHAHLRPVPRELVLAARREVAGRSYFKHHAPVPDTEEEEPVEVD